MHDRPERRAEASELVLAEQLLMNAGISEDHKLLVRTAVGEKFTFERVAK